MPSLRILFAGSIHGGLVSALRASGHEVHDPRSTDWWASMTSNHTPEHWADSVAHEIVTFRPDVFVMMKGFHADWCVPERLLAWVRKRVQTMVLACADDPAVTPLLLAKRIPTHFNLWLTSCVGIDRLFALPPGPRLVEWPPGYDQRIGQIPVVPEYQVDVAICGSTYPAPWAAPHYSTGFGIARREYARALLADGIGVGIWGPPDWLDESKGGDPAFEPYFHGWLAQDQIHRVHANARINLATQLVEGWRYLSERIQTVGGARGVLVHERRPGLEDETGDAVAYFAPGNVSEAVATVKRLLADPEECERMRSALHSLVMERHTWTVRAAQLLRAIEEVRS